jgi:hypothetical protein
MVNGRISLFYFSTEKETSSIADHETISVLGFLSFAHARKLSLSHHSSPLFLIIIIIIIISLSLFPFPFSLSLS